MDREDYDGKLHSMLQDTITYCRIEKDPSLGLERRMNSMLLDLRKKGELSDTVYQRLRSPAGRTPLLYGLPKVHKPGTPLRPIVSFIQSPTYHLSQHLSHLLSPLVGTSSSAVRNSKDFADFIVTQEMKGESLVSFDVISLFTNIPTDLAVDAAFRLSMDDTLSERTDLSVQSITSLLRLCLDATFFSFRGQYYQQTFGTAMGSPVSVTVANLVMEEIEQQAISTFNPPPRFWKCYVDDTCTAIPTEPVPTFHHHLNSISPHIQFTVEKESDQSLPFLDELLTHQADGTISTLVFRKSTHTDKYLDFTSHHPLAHKVSVIRTFTTAPRHCPLTHYSAQMKSLMSPEHSDTTAILDI